MLVPVLDNDGGPSSDDRRQGAHRRQRQRRADELTATARDVYAEGALIFPCVKIQQDYRG